MSEFFNQFLGTTAFCLQPFALGKSSLDARKSIHNGGNTTYGSILSQISCF